MNIAQICKNAATNYGRMVVTIVAAVILTPFILSKLGQEAYGLWCLSQAIASYFGLIDFGITGATVRYIAHYRALRDWQSFNEVIGSSLVYYIVCAVLSIVAALVLSYVSPVIFRHLTLTDQLRYLIMFAGLTAVVGFLSIIPSQCVIAAQRQDLLNNWLLCFQIVSAFATFFCVATGKGVMVLALIQLINSALNALVSYILMRQLMPEARLIPRWSTDKGKIVLQFAGWTFVITAAGRLILYSDALVIGSVISMAAIAGYAVVLKIVEVLRSAVNAGVGVLGTFISEQDALGNRDSLGYMWIEGSKWSLIILIPAWFACVMIPGELIQSWIGTVYAGTQLTLIWLATSALVDGSQSVSYQILMNSGRHRSVALCLIAEGVINLCLSIVLAKLWGIAGVAFGTLIPCFIRSVIVFPLFMRKATRLTLGEYVKAAVYPAIALSVPTCGLIAGYRLLGLHTGRISIGLLILACGFSLITCVYFLGIKANQRKRIYELVKAKLLQASGKKAALTESECVYQTELVAK